MTYDIDKAKHMIHRCNSDRSPTYCVVAEATNSGATQTIKASNPMSEVINDVLTHHTQAEALAKCVTKLNALDGAIT